MKTILLLLFNKYLLKLSQFQNLNIHNINHYSKNKKKKNSVKITFKANVI